MAILGELPLTEGSITVKGKIAYASQQAWVYNGSLRQNILFGQDYDEDKFKEVIKACALDKVCNCFPLQAFCCKYLYRVEPRFNEVAGDRPNLFVKWRVRYIEVLFHTFYCNFGRDIEIISFVISRTSLNRGSLNRGSSNIFLFILKA